MINLLNGDKSKSHCVIEPRLSPDLQIGQSDSVFMGNTRDGIYQTQFRQFCLDRRQPAN